jgi:hypothetical protein
VHSGSLLRGRINGNLPIYWPSSAFHALAVDDGSGGAGFALALLTALQIKRVMDAIAMRVGTDLELIGDWVFFACRPVNDLCALLPQCDKVATW